MGELGGRREDTKQSRGGEWWEGVSVWDTETNGEPMHEDPSEKRSDDSVDEPWRF